MKRTTLGVILGMASLATVFGQGHVAISNYTTPPYNQVVWDASIPGVGGTGVIDTAVQLQIWYGAGTLSDASLLTPGVTFTVNPSYTFVGAAGTGGYYDAQIQELSGWSAGQTYTFQVRASGATIYGNVFGSSALWQEAAALTGSSVGITSSANPAGSGTFSPGLIVSVPEPTTFALAGLGIASMLIFRRRKA